MPEQSSTDNYAKGMVNYGEEQVDCTPEYDHFQYSLFREYIQNRVLEVGAGDGRITALAMGNDRLQELVALEPSPHFARLFHRRISPDPRVTLLQKETGALRPTHLDYFDCVFSVHVMEHIENDRQFVEDMLAMTKPGGVVVILVPALQWLYSNFDRTIGHFRRYDKSIIRQLTKGLDVEIERMFYNNMLGVVASLVVVKMRRLDYQRKQNKTTFFRLYSLYSKYLVPAVQVAESIVPVPFGLNLTVILRKPKTPS
jgi:2-polyprenyl-3-methyl-5-hydroxy-6-metoxy-1,4-benzoquinol methylase